MSKDSKDTTTNNTTSDKDQPTHWISEMRNNREAIRNHDKEEFAKLESDQEYRMLFVTSDLTADDEELEQAKKYAKGDNAPDDKQQEEDIKPSSDETTPVPVTTEKADEVTPEESRTVTKIEKKTKPSVLQDAGIRAKEIQQELRQELGFEYLIGETGTKIAGAGILLFSFAILINELEKMGYISEWFRVVIGLAVSTSLLFVAYQQRNIRPTTSNLIAIVGFIGFYFMNYISYGIYGFYNAVIFLLINILSTIFILNVSLRLRNIALFYMAIIGVCYSPVVVRLQIDYTYIIFYLVVSIMLIMNIAYRRNWNHINIALYALVMIPMLHWLYTKSPAVEQYGLTFGIVTTVCGWFFGMVLAFGIDRNKKLKSTEYFMYYCSIFLYLICGLNIMRYDAGMSWGEYSTFVFAMGLFLAGISALMYVRQPFDNILFEYTQLLSLILVTFSIPFLTSATNWNFFWIVESVLLLWIAQATTLGTVRNFSGGTACLAILMLLHDWIITYTGAYQSFFFNGAVKSTVYTVIGLSISVYLMISNKDKYKSNDTILFLTYEIYQKILGGLVVFILWVIGNIELGYHNFTSYHQSILLSGIFNSLFFSILWKTSKHYSLDARKFIEAAILFIIVAYLFIDRFSISSLRNAYLVDGASGWHFMTHYALLGSIIFISTIILQTIQKSDRLLFTKLLWFLVPLIIAYLSFEFEHLLTILSYAPGDSISDLLNNIWHIGWEILWAIIAVAMIGLGIRYQLKPLRMMALFLFAGILLKFFAYDFWKLSMLQKLVSTIILGLLLIGVGNQYGQKFLTIINEGKIPDSKDDNQSTN